MAKDTTPAGSGDDARDEDAETRELPADREAETQRIDPAPEAQTTGEPTAAKPPVGERLRPFAIPAGAAAVALIVGGIGGYGIAQATGAGTLQSSASGPAQGPAGSGYGPSDGGASGGPAQGGPGQDDRGGAENGTGRDTAPTDAPEPPADGPAEDGPAKDDTGKNATKGDRPKPPAGAGDRMPSRPSGAPTPPSGAPTSES